LAIAGFGLLLTGQLKGWDRSESALNRPLQDTQSRTWDSITALWSHVGNSADPGQCAEPDRGYNTTIERAWLRRTVQAGCPGRCRRGHRCAVMAPDPHSLHFALRDALPHRPARRRGLQSVRTTALPRLRLSGVHHRHDLSGLDTDLQAPAIGAIALRHALLSFLFGAIIVATTVNLGAGLGGGSSGSG